MNHIFTRCIVLLTLAGLLAACTNGTVLATVYGRFGSSSAKQFKSYATFNAEQKTTIDRLAEKYHSWHRSTQLPLYAQWLRSLVDDINNAQITEETTDRWLSDIRVFADELRTCNPFNVSADFLVELSDKQVQQIALRLRAEINEREDEYLEETAEQRIDRRYKEIRKWGNRIGASFNGQQERILLKTLTDQVSMGKQRYELRRIWIEQFIVTLQGREQAGFKSDVAQHINKIWNLTANGFPEKWKTNEQLWTVFLSDYINLQNDEQRKEFVGKALSTATTLDKIALKTMPAAPVCHRAVGGD